ncbi:hypothetical protein J4557_40710 [Actinomadura nitritigenes]|uniref:Uncharacterized protein n=1 Tax=Actinomadura nitritigenes TaxID=134602 RepID=A0ABS3RCA5_9ACTN|nr:hypothetical protein [Actinomadura nitritigenes]MBO2443863.1 hypothetical protein [Actinomadura nitritigenes]
MAATVHHALLDGGLRPDLLDRLGQALEAVAAGDAHVLHAAIAQFGQHGHPVLGALTTGPDPQSEHVPLAVAVDAHRHVDRTVGHLTLADLDVEGVDQHDRIHRIERPSPPGLHLFHDFVGDPRDQVARHLDLIDLGQVRADLPGGQALGIQRGDRLVEPFDPAGVLGHDLRLEHPRPVPRHLDPHRPDLGRHRLSRGAVAVVAGRDGRAFAPLIAQMIGHLGFQRGLQHGLGDPGRQPVRPDQRHPLGPGLRGQLSSELDLQTTSGLVLVVVGHV